jgi:hypothetical protein
VGVERSSLSLEFVSWDEGRVEGRLIDNLTFLFVALFFMVYCTRLRTWTGALGFAGSTLQGRLRWAHTEEKQGGRKSR